MRILQVISHYVPAYRFGGPLQTAHELGKAMVAQGHEVRVCASNLKDRQSNLETPLDQVVDVDGVRVFYEPVVLSRKWGFSPAMARRLAQEIQRADFVLVHAHFQFANWIGALLCRRYQKPYVIFAHSSLRHAALKSSSYCSKRAYLRLMEWQNLKSARFIAFNAEEEMEDSFFSERGHVIPNGIDPGSFEPCPPKGSFRQKYPELIGKICFLFLGRIDIKQKAVDRIVEAFSSVALQDSNLHLILAGPSEGGDGDVIRSLLQQRRLIGRVTMAGLVSGVEKIALMQDADVFLLPSHFEGLSIALLEAMSLRLPVIVSRKVGLCRQIQRRHCGIVVDGSTDSISQGMMQMLAPEARLAMGNNSRELVLENHTWHRIASLLLEKLC